VSEYTRPLAKDCEPAVAAAHAVLKLLARALGR
jgi:hypothetical protein